jgi:RsiW-degrading membrane proteinase PrsW (M82 family)
MFVVAVLLSFIPAILYAWVIYWIDRYEKEPRVLLWGVFIWGAVVAAGASFVLNTAVGVSVFDLTGSSVLANYAKGNIAAPLFEETFKAFAVLIIFIVRRDELDSIVDGIAYAAIAALGFAATENVFYLYERGFVEAGLQGMGINFVFRVILGAWNHSFYTAFIGVGFAISRLSSKKILEWGAPILGWIIAVSLHFAHNSLHSTAEGFDNLMLVIAVDWLGWLALGFLIVWALRREHNWIVDELVSEVENGVITQEQYDTIEKGWLKELATFGDYAYHKHQEAHHLYHAASELAYKKHQRREVGEEYGNTTEMIEQLRLEVGRMSRELIAYQTESANAKKKKKKKKQKEK